MNEPAIIHTDGACSGNPGPGGFAAIIEMEGNELTITGGDPKTTNNRMELSAVIEALPAINSAEDLRHSQVTIRSDSQYIVKAFNDNWIEGWQKNGWRTAKKQPVLNRDLWEALLKEIAPHTAEFIWVKGHAGDPMNERCDRLAVEQGGYAPSQDAYWVSAGNPRTAASEVQEPMGTEPESAATALSILELVLERNEIALTAVKVAINLLDKGSTGAARDKTERAFRHLEAQYRLLQESTPSTSRNSAPVPDDLPF